MPAPLEGLKVLDFTTLLPGPFGTMMLADLGAEVLRVEAPNRVDLLKMMPPLDGDVSGAHRMINRSKASIALDMKAPLAVDVVKRLVQTYDIVVEQFRPGVMDRLGVGYAALSEINSGLIFCSITGYGQDGPYRDRAGHDNNYLALSGIMSYCGRNGSGPVPNGIQIADQVAGGYNAILAILAAVIWRNKTGQGQAIDISMTDGAKSLGLLSAMKCLTSGEIAGRETEMLNGGVYYDYYRTADGGYMSVGSLEPQFFRALCLALERPELETESDTAVLKRDLAAAFAARTTEDWTRIFAGTDACVEPVLDVNEMLEHPLTQARAMVVEVPRPDGTLQKQLASPFKFSSCCPVYRHVGLGVGSNTQEVLEGLGYSAEEIERIGQQGTT